MSRRLSPEDQHRRELILDAASLVHRRRLAASPWRRRLAQRRVVCRMGWYWR